MIEIRTGCRLHFGLLEICRTAPLCYGGLGLMVEQPNCHLGIQLPVEAVEQTSLADRAQEGDELAGKLHKVWSRMNRESSGAFANVKIETRETLPLHSGLGAGTQIGCAAAVLLDLYDRHHRGTLQAQLCDGHWQAVESLGWTDSLLVEKSGRGLRSAIGTSGFLRGGLVFDHGYVASKEQTTAGNRRTVETQHLQLNADWRIVMGRPEGSLPVSGSKESRLFEELSRHENPHRDQMFALAEGVLKAGAKQDYVSFCEQLELYMELAGGVFSSIQGGLYNGAAVEQSVHMLRDSGLQAVGQSSWGPTVFGFAMTEPQADEVVRKLQAESPQNNWVVAAPAAGGAKFRIGKDC